MKKVFILMLVLVMAVGIVGCSSASDEEATSTPQPTQEAAPMNPSTNWELSYIVDEFGDATEEECLRGIFTGSFSNTATTGSDLDVVVFFTPAFTNDEMVASFSFRLLEYGDKFATYSKNEDIILKVKIGEDVYKDVLIGTPPKGDLYLINSFNIRSESLGDIYDALIANEQDVKCVIEIGSSKYSFKMNGNGFSETMEGLEKRYGIGVME